MSNYNILQPITANISPDDIDEDIKSVGSTVITLMQSENTDRWYVRVHVPVNHVSGAIVRRELYFRLNETLELIDAANPVTTLDELLGKIIDEALS